MPAKGRSANTLYHGVGGPGPGPRTVRVNGRILDLKPSLVLRRHSPDGFGWGYSGSGPAQLSLALLLDYTGSRDLALTLYPRFRDVVVAGWRRGEEWWMTGEEMETAIAIIQAESTPANVEHLTPKEHAVRHALSPASPLVRARAETLHDLCSCRIGIVDPMCPLHGRDSGSAEGGDP